MNFYFLALISLARFSNLIASALRLNILNNLALSSNGSTSQESPLPKANSTVLIIISRVFRHQHIFFVQRAFEQ